MRLHVLANSDSEEDQALKLKVRDAVLDCARELLGDTCSADEAYAILAENIATVEACARQAAENAGFFGAVQAQTGVFSFPGRQYGDLLVPAGEYRAVRVLLGEGAGQNWWCVIYPTLCAIDEKGEFARESAEIVDVYKRQARDMALAAWCGRSMKTARWGRSMSFCIPPWRVMIASIAGILIIRIAKMRGLSPRAMNCSRTRAPRCNGGKKTAIARMIFFPFAGRARRITIMNCRMGGWWACGSARAWPSAKTAAKHGRK